MWFIGDIHRQFDTYLWITQKMQVGADRPSNSYHWFDETPAIVQQQAELFQGIGLDQSLQVGDFGIFKTDDLNITAGINHKFIRGNHDHPELCNEHKDYLGDFGYIPDMSLFFAAGGYSIDKHRRTTNVNWWENEELTTSQWWKVFELYLEKKPTIMVSHECPTIVKDEALLASPYNVNMDFKITSGTEVALQNLYNEHQPDLWVFGHYHGKLDVKIGKTRFVCCGAANLVPVKDVVFEVPGLTWPEKLNIIT